MGMWVLGTLFLAYLHSVSGVSSPPVQANTPVRSAIQKLRSHKARGILSVGPNGTVFFMGNSVYALFSMLKACAAMQGNDDHFVAVDDGDFVVGCEAFYPAVYNQYEPSLEQSIFEEDDRPCTECIVTGNWENGGLHVAGCLQRCIVAHHDLRYF